MGKHGFIPDEHLPEVERLAGQGLNDKEIAISLGISRRSLYNYKRLSMRFLHAIKKGRANAHEVLVNVLYLAAKDEKNYSAAMFLLKTQHGYRENGPIKSEDQDAPTSSKITYIEIDGRKK